MELPPLDEDKSLLTGESAPVLKQAASPVNGVPAEPDADVRGRVFSGTLVTQGTGVGRVTATGERSALGRIGHSLRAIATENTPIQMETARIVKRTAVAGLVLAAVLAAAYWAVLGDWLHGLLAGLTFAMAVIPEELPVVLTLFLGLGAWRLAREKVLARSIPAVELLGATTVLCVDKTGTLTANRMAVSRLWTDGANDDMARALTFTVLVLSNLALIHVNRRWNRIALRAGMPTNASFGWMALATVVLLGVVLSIPAVSCLFAFVLPTPTMLLAGVGVSTLGLLWFEAVKLAGGDRWRPG